MQTSLSYSKPELIWVEISMSDCIMAASVADVENLSVNTYEWED